MSKRGVGGLCEKYSSFSETEARTPLNRLVITLKKGKHQITNKQTNNLIQELLYGVVDKEAY